MIEPNPLSLPKKIFRLLVYTAWSLTVILFLEVVAQLYVRYVAHRGKLFTVDAVLGWRPKANLALTRRNADGDDWRVVTDSAGWRTTPTASANATRRVYVLGDSYAFGEGVNAEARFDELVARQRPDLLFVNRAVMGFGTDQQLLAMAPDSDSMRVGDFVLLLTYQNDMIDIQRRRFAGRAKPYFERSSDSLLLHLPQITWRERLRDQSYLGALLFASRERPFQSYTADEWRRGLQLYADIVRREAGRLSQKGVPLIVVHYGDSVLAEATGLSRPYAMLDAVPNTRGFSLDSALRHCPDSVVFLRDGHWGPGGHRCVGRRVHAILADFSSNSDRDSVPRRLSAR